MSIYDGLVILILVFGLFLGYQRGFLKQTVDFVVLLITMIIASPLSKLLCKLLYPVLPFFNFSGDAKGLKAINLIVWRLIIYFLLIANKKAFCYTMCIIALVAGVTVNPINRGTDVLYKTEIAQKIQEISSKDESGLWIGNTNLAGQYLVANGVKTLNGVNSYPKHSSNCICKASSFGKAKPGCFIL